MRVDAREIPVKKFLLMAACAAALTACSKAANDASQGDVTDDAPKAEAAAAPADVSPPPGANDAVADPAAPQTSTPATRPNATARAIKVTPALSMPKLAYRHHYAIETPARSVALLVDKHEAACQAAGPAICQVTGANVRRESENNVFGTLSMRAEPVWLAGFRKGLADDAAAVGGKIATNETRTDELSRAMVDTDAEITAKTVMRDRIEDLVRTHKGSLNDLVDLERQLAGVQGEIDAARANLVMMRGQVTMSDITIDYGPKAGLAVDGAWAPVTSAIRSSQGLMANTIAVVITFLAVLGPLALLGFGVWYGVNRLGRRGKTSPTTALSPQPAP